MSLVSGISDATGAVSGLAGGNAALNNVNFDTFLKLLVAQLKNQDPLNPLDGTQFTGQIAQFSSLEQQINGNNYLKEILAQRDFGEQTLANSYLGNEVLGPGNLLAYEGGGATIAYEPDARARAMTVELIHNETGQVVRTVQGDVSGGPRLYEWNGKTDAGTDAPAGTYTLRARATDEEGKVVPSATYTFGLVNSVLSDGNAVYLQMADGRAILAKEALGVRQNTAGQGS